MLATFEKYLDELNPKMPKRKGNATCRLGARKSMAERLKAPL